MGYRYIGSKARIADEIIEYIDYNGEGYFIDAFSGTGIVAHKAANMGWKVKVNDMMKNAVVMTVAGLVSEEDVHFDFVGGYEACIDYLNKLEPEKGYFWRVYSPASSQFEDVERRYFTENNASKIDAIVNQIHSWNKQRVINEYEFIILMADVIVATNSVANIAGTYGCFLSKWTKQSEKDFWIEKRLLRRKKIDFMHSNRDVFEIESEENDVVYFDPPYTKRQYASYYHILESIVCGDEIQVEGTSGLRPWRDKASVFCYKKKALNALVQLIIKQKARRVILSYSDDGHVNLSELVTELRKTGEVEIVELKSIARYTPNKTAVNNKTVVKEYLIDYRKKDKK